MTIYICAPQAFTYRTVRRCPTCDRRRRFVVDLFEWYPAIWSCCGCGDQWSEDGRQQRPFARGWRTGAIEHAKAKWAEATTRVKATDALMASFLGPEDE